MTNAYDSLYLDKAKASLAGMLDFAVRELQQDASAFMELFISSGLAELFSRGDVRTIAGSSGPELAYAVLERSGMRTDHVSPHFSPYRSNEYRAGQFLARFQWETSYSFADIVSAMPVRELIELCDPSRETDEQKLSESIISRITGSHVDTRLKIMRQRNGLSQSRLAALSSVPLRTIQQYEQRQKDINKARFEYLVSLSKALNCEPHDLLEMDILQAE